ncbi:unnamed protein product [Notodromas monacha]|uniref:Metalloendopeptidase n=1 Tax=Notodromas monacha TaxID=399045 RepID=A0A7R9C1S0_9CRUS|nr:unnamed protein product [Notodromas monacha]CAG0924489.1 unnamed protein product [Notodromas monacha]
MRRHVVGACYSKLGFIGGKQEICLSDKGVNRKGTIMHEVMHALGFDHEHSRPDRDKFVFVNWCNISQGFEPQFKIRYGKLSENGRYDYGSVMHYPAHAFADLKLLPTIIPNKKHIGPRGIGQRLWLSPDDVYKINAAYTATPERSGYATANPDAMEHYSADNHADLHRFFPPMDKLHFQMRFRPIVEEVCEPDENIRQKVLKKKWGKSRKTRLKLAEIKGKYSEMTKERIRLKSRCHRSKRTATAAKRAKLQKIRDHRMLLSQGKPNPRNP